MALTAGTQLGPYEILAPIGAGGMGEVYRARDTRLDRTVAIKVLPEHLSSQADLRDRFEREARAISAINHPNICVLHDIGQQDGLDYLVMEYLEGETLAKRLEKGALPIAQVFKYSIEIADALDRAHRQGITHRDLKPGNIMITSSGAKLLDFGLAKFRQPEKQTSSVSTLPTQASQLTAHGMILGTVQYMSPEQLEGGEADPRSDLFAFGAVLYEMLSGRKAFEGKSQASLIAAIMHVDPPWVSVWEPLTPPPLDRVVRKCLAKNPDERWQSARDLVDELRWISDPSQSAGSSVVSAVPAPASAARTPRWPLAVALIFVVSTAVLLALIVTHREPRTFGMIRMELRPPDKNSFRGGLTAPQFAVSSDGRMLAFSATENGKVLIWVRAFDSAASQPFPATEGGQLPFWSPDGRYVGFFADGKLKKIELSGGLPLTLCGTSPNGEGASWSKDGVIVFSPATSNSGILRVSESGGDAVEVTKVNPETEVGHVWPQFLPDGRHFIYLSIGKAAERSAIYLGSLDGEAPRRLIQSTFRAAYASGYLLFMRETVLMAQPFDAKRLALSGEPVRVADQVATNNVSGRAAFAVSESGMLAYRINGSGGVQQQLVWIDRQGKSAVLVPDSAQYRTHDLSADGKRLVMHRHDSATNKGDLWILELDRNQTTRFTFDGNHNFAPIWSPDGTRVVYASARKGNTDDLYQKLANGAAGEDLLLESPGSKHPDDWSKDGRYILYESSAGPTNSDLFVLPTFGDKQPIPFAKTPFNERKGRFSPDGKWIAYTSNESGADQVYIQPFPPNGGKWQISTKANGVIRTSASLDR